MKTKKMSYATQAPSSFHKRAKIKIGQILGTRPSLYNNQLLISSGIPSLDNVIGGGLAVGTVLLIEEDKYGSYARIMLKYFVAEGVMTDQSIFLSSANEVPQHLVKELPAPLDDTGHTTVNSSQSPSTQQSPQKDASAAETTSDEKLKIAWRYQSKPKVQSAPTSNIRFGHYYDLTKSMNDEKIKAADISFEHYLLDVNPLSIPSIPCMNLKYHQLLQHIKSRIERGMFSTTQQVEKRRILRIGIHSLGSPLWGESGGKRSDKDGFDPSLSLFLIGLRGILRSAFAVAMITLPTTLFHDKAFIKRVERMCDTVIKLESFAGSPNEKNPLFKEYHGFLHVVQLPHLNSLIPAQPTTTDLAFKLRRKKFTIEKFHLPPELADNVSEDKTNSGSKSGCGASENSKLSF
ncbi:elongator complex protein 4-like [Physella acuta]|uniref:elongator complex protein 4-like n=1 Tax=Physella acuta TaxID=109671 RepID=UPI0027DB610B|nr:elongator complex protein 4-like [Physella acuta]XP_059157778.1 elongator complex protein 4-like [Physella acuta]